MLLIVVLLWWIYCVFFFKQKTAYEMRISDWSSDVCSSDLDVLTGLWHRTISGRANQDRAIHLGSTGDHVFYVVGVTWAVNVCVVTHGRIVFNVSGEIGRASCRERVCQYE